MTLNSIDINWASLQRIGKKNKKKIITDKIPQSNVQRSIYRITANLDIQPHFLKKVFFYGDVNTSYWLVL